MWETYWIWIGIVLFLNILIEIRGIKRVLHRRVRRYCHLVGSFISTLVENWQNYTQICLKKKGNMGAHIIKNSLDWPWLPAGVDLRIQKIPSGASLVAQWLRVCLPVQGTRVRALVWEDPTCRGATGPVSYNYWACASGACAPQQERPR